MPIIRLQLIWRSLDQTLAGNLWALLQDLVDCKKKYFIKPVCATAVDVPTDKSNVIISLFPAGIRFWSRIMALFLNVFTHPVAEVNITEANWDTLEVS